MTKMRLICPKCKADNIKLRSRRIYLKRILFCLAAFALCGLLLFAIFNEDNNEGGTVLLAFLFATGMMLILLIVILIWLVRAIITKKATYKCSNCGNIFETPEFAPPLTEEELRNTFTRKKIRKDGTAVRV